MTTKEYHAHYNACWQLFKKVRENEQSLDWAVKEGERILKESGNDLMIKGIIFAIWNQLDRDSQKQIEMKDIIYGQPLNR